MIRPLIAAALLVLRKNLAAIFNRDKGEDE